MSSNFYIYRIPSLPNYVKIILICNFVFSFVAGIIFNSRAFAADGVFSLIFLCELFKIENKKRRFIPLSIVSIVTALYVCVVSFFEMSKTISYFDTAVNFIIFPFIAVSVIAKIVIFFAVKDNKGKLKGKEYLYSIISLVFSAFVVLSIFLSVYVEFYLEPIIALAISAFCIYKAILYIIHRNIEPKEDEIPQDLIKDEDQTHDN